MHSFLQITPGFVTNANFVNPSMKAFSLSACFIQLPIVSIGLLPGGFHLIFVQKKLHPQSKTWLSPVVGAFLFILCDLMLILHTANRLFNTQIADGKNARLPGR